MTIEDPVPQAAKKPFYKRWWFLTPIIAIGSIFLFIIAVLLFVPDPADTTESTEQELVLHPIGQAVEAPGVTLTVDSVTRSDSIELYADGYKRGYMPNETETAGDGEYVSISTTLTNTGPAPMDLTCGFGVRAILTNTDTQAYDPIDDLSRIIDNPECNASLNPQMETKMTWTYLIPKDAELGAFGFTNPEVSYEGLEFVDLRDAS